MPTISAHVPDDWQFKDQFNHRIASPKYRGKPGRYLIELVEADLSGHAIGAPHSAYSHEDIMRWMDDEDALLRAAPLSLTVLYSTDAAARDKAAREMAHILSQAALRRPKKEMLAAEEPGHYGVGTPSHRQTPVQPKKKKRA